MTPDERYASFLLRLQWMKNGQQPTWIVSMQSTKTGTLRWFPNLEALITFLREEFGEYERDAESDAKSIEKDHQAPGNRRAEKVMPGGEPAKEEQV